MISGQQGAFYWVEWRAQFLSDLIRAFPESVFNKYLVVTSFDSGALSLSEEELRKGWYQQGEYAYSPILTDIHILPYDQYDEWYIFEYPTILDDIEVFINYWGFSLAHAEDVINVGDEEVENSPSRPLDSQIRFWQQLERIVPESYLAEGDNLIFITRDQQLFERVSRWKYPRQES